MGALLFSPLNLETKRRRKVPGAFPSPMHTHAHCTRADAHRQMGLQEGALSNVFSLGQVHTQVGAHLHPPRIRLPERFMDPNLVCLCRVLFPSPPTSPHFQIFPLVSHRTRAHCLLLSPSFPSFSPVCWLAFRSGPGNRRNKSGSQQEGVCKVPKARQQGEAGKPRHHQKSNSIPIYCGYWVPAPW